MGNESSDVTNVIKLYKLCLLCNRRHAADYSVSMCSQLSMWICCCCLFELVCFFAATTLEHFFPHRLWFISKVYSYSNAAITEKKSNHYYPLAVPLGQFNQIFKTNVH